MIEWLVVAAVVAIAGAAATTLSSTVRLRVSHWLREHGLNHSALMDAWILLDGTAGRIRGRLRLRTATYGTTVLTLERDFTWDEIDDPVLLAAVRSAGHAETLILDQLT